MIAVIRISGMIGIDESLKEGLYRLRLRRKYACVLIEDTKENRKLLSRLRNVVAYGKISPETQKELVEKRALPIDKSTKIDAEKVSKEIGKKSFEELGIKPFFRLHPPRGGIESKKHFGVSSRAVLGDNGDKINDLIRRML